MDCYNRVNVHLGFSLVFAREVFFQPVVVPVLSIYNPKEKRVRVIQVQVPG